MNMPKTQDPADSASARGADVRHQLVAFALMVAVLAVAPFVVYPVFPMKVMCFALFACAFNLLLGYGGLMSFGHAMFLGTAGYVCAHAAKVWGLQPEFALAPVNARIWPKAVAPVRIINIITVI